MAKKAQSKPLPYSMMNAKQVLSKGKLMNLLVKLGIHSVISYKDLDTLRKALGAFLPRV
jgi:hypothetical protein